MTSHHLKKSRHMSALAISVLLDEPMLLGECPIWQPDEASLYWIDIPAHAVHRLHPQSGAHQVWSLPSEPGCIAFTDAGSLLVAMRTGLALLDTLSGRLTDYLSAPYDSRFGRFNDGRCDAAGRLWIGSLYDSRDRQGGSLYCVERGTIRDLGRPVTVSNGIAFSNDNRRLYHSDTTAHRITVSDFDVGTGTLSPARLFQQFPSARNALYGGRPDGAAVDAEGAYWCAMYEGGRIIRLGPDGVLLQEIQLPIRCPTMMAFGGPDLRTLFITSARHNRPREEVEKLPHSGYLLSIHVDVPGLKEHLYTL